MIEKITKPQFVKIKWKCSSLSSKRAEQRSKIRPLQVDHSSLFALLQICCFFPPDLCALQILVGRSTLWAGNLVARRPLTLNSPQSTISPFSWIKVNLGTPMLCARIFHEMVIKRGHLPPGMDNGGRLLIVVTVWLTSNVMVDFHSPYSNH